MSLKETLDFLGVPPMPSLVAAAWGSLSAIFMMGRVSPFEAAGTFIVGMGTAAYLGDYISQAAGVSGGALSYVAGLTGMYVCQLIIEMAKRWRLPGMQERPDDGKSGE